MLYWNVGFTLFLVITFLILLAILLWLRWKMAVSKARFALMTVLTMASCAAALLTFISGPIPIQILNAAVLATQKVTGLDWIPILPAEPGYFAASLAIGSGWLRVIRRKSLNAGKQR